MSQPVGPLADLFDGLAGCGERLFGRGGDPLARLAANHVAESILEALGTAVGREASLCLRLLRGTLLAVAPTCPRRTGLAESRRAVERYREDEEPDGAV